MDKNDKKACMTTQLEWYKQSERLPRPAYMDSATQSVQVVLLCLRTWSISSAYYNYNEKRWYIQDSGQRNWRPLYVEDAVWSYTDNMINTPESRALQSSPVIDAFVPTTVETRH